MKLLWWRAVNLILFNRLFSAWLWYILVDWQCCLDHGSACLLVYLLEAPDQNEFSCLHCASGLLLHFFHNPDHSGDILEVLKKQKKFYWPTEVFVRVPCLTERLIAMLHNGFFYVLFTCLLLSLAVSGSLVLVSLFFHSNIYFHIYFLTVQTYSGVFLQNNYNLIGSEMLSLVNRQNLKYKKP